MLKKIIVYFVFVAFFMTLQGCASYRGFSYKGINLKEDCDSSTTSDLDFCYGYLRGVDSTVVYYFEEGGVNELSELYCLKNQLTYQDERTAIIDWINKHPEHAEDSAWSIVHRALSETFPCDDLKLDDLEDSSNEKGSTTPK